LIDIRNNPLILETINAILNNKGIAEIKSEKNGLCVVEIKRTLKTQKNTDGNGEK
jgi:transcriptional antiterminator